MKKILVCTAILLTIMSFSKAQQMPLYSQYMLNGFLLNPAMAGNVNYVPLRLTVRQQWVGITDAPSTQAISAHHLFNNKKMGLGGYIYNDMFGPVRQTGIQACYSYHIQLGTNNKLAIGIAIKAFQFEYDETTLTVIDENDPVVLNKKESTFIPDADLGVYFYDSEHKYFAGFSATQLVELDVKINEENKNSMVRHYYLTGGYKFNVVDEIDIEPSFLLKGTEKTPFQIDFNAKCYYKKNYWIGVSYRTAQDIVVMFGIKVDRYSIGYAFDYPFSNINNFTSGSHEIMIGINIDEGTNVGSSLL
ncbi:MAG: type IX secretion system membrane protein PorP/SprF [Bacteroidota bacterium]